MLLVVIQSKSDWSSTDVLAMIRHHFHKNDLVYSHAAKVVEQAVNRKERVLVLIDEVGQFPRLLRACKIPLKLAHGGVTDPKRKKELLKEYHKSDPMALVKAFDAGEFPVLVGTSCIGMGTDVKSVTTIVDMVHDSSETRVRQSVGRGTRLFPEKNRCMYFDYVVKNVPPLQKQGMKRNKIFNDIYGPVRTVDLG